MLERLDRRSVTLLDVVNLCNRQAALLKESYDAVNHVVPPATSHVLFTSYSV